MPRLLAVLLIAACFVTGVDAAAAPPTIVTQPVDAEFPDGFTATFTVDATGTAPLSYRWQRDGADIVGAANSPRLDYWVEHTDDGATFRVIVSNAAGSVTSSDAHLMVPSRAPDSAIYFAADDDCRVYANGLGPVTPLRGWSDAGPATYTGTVDCLAIEATNATAAGGVIARVVEADGSTYVSDATWKAYAGAPPLDAQGRAWTASDYDDSAWLPATALGAYGIAPWTRQPGLEGVAGAQWLWSGPTIGTVCVRRRFSPAPPAITVQPVARSVAPGEAVAFSVSASGSAPFTFQWQRGGVAIAGATGRRYVTPPTTLADDGARYRCVVTNALGSVASSEATLTVRAPVARGPYGGTPWPIPGRIEAERFDDGGEGVAYHDTDAVNQGGAYRTTGVDIYSDANAQSGKAVGWIAAGEWLEYTVNVAATGAYAIGARVAQPGGGSTFHLLLDGAPIGASFTAPDTGTWNSYARVTRSNIVVPSGRHVLRVVFDSASATGFCELDYVEFTPLYPVITAQPQPTTATEWQGATFTIAATGNPTYQWQRNGLNVANGNAATYTTPPVHPYDQGALYRCVLLNASGNVVSAEVPLSVIPVYVAPTLTRPMKGASVYVGSSATFEVDVDGTRPFTYQWRRAGIPIPGAPDQFLYTTPPATLADNGVEYSVVVSNPGGSITVAAQLAVTGPVPSIFSQPADQTVVEGANAIFTAQITGDPAVSYRWQRDGVDIPGATTATCVIWNTTLADSGAHVRVIASNVNGSVTSAYATLTVTPAPPTITTGPVDAARVTGQTATFSVVATGSAPLAYQWQKGGVAVPGATAASYTTPALTLTDDGTAWRCVVTNVAGTATSSTATLTVKSFRQPFGGTPWPVPGRIEGECFDDGGEGVTWHDTDGVNQGGVFRTGGVDVYSDPNAQNGKVVGSVAPGEWLEYTVAIAQAGSYTLTARVAQPGGGSTFHVAIDGASVAAFTAPNTGAWNAYQKVAQRFVALPAGQHVVRVAFDAAGATGVCAFDYLQFTSDLPVITAQPTDTTVYTGQTATFRVSATANPAPTYQWQRDGVDIPGATAATYTTPPTSRADTFTHFRCVVASGPASVTSAEAVLTVPIRNPYGYVPWPIPGRIEAENFDVGPDGIAYHDTDPQNLGGAYRSTGVDIYADPAAQSGRTVGSTAPGEWLEYTVSVAAYGTYALTARVALPGGGGTFQVLLDGSSLSGVVTVPDTGGWSSFTKVAAGTRVLAGGGHVIRVEFDSAGPNGCPRFDCLDVNALTPVITSNLQDVTVAVGERATFTVGAVGAGALTYQWQRGNEFIAGATSATYVTPPVTAADAGSVYLVQVMNAYGSTSSRFATLTVVPAPTAPQ